MTVSRGSVWWTTCLPSSVLLLLLMMKGVSLLSLFFYAPLVLLHHCYCWYSKPVVQPHTRCVCDWIKLNAEHNHR